MNHAVVALLVVGALVHGKAVEADDKRCVCALNDGENDDAEDTPMLDRMRSFNQKMNRLIAQAEYLAMRLGSSRTDEKEVRVKHLKLRIGALEGSGCGEHEFACGDTTGQCLSDLLVCNGHQGCSNNHDEDNVTCTNPLVPGYHFKGRVVFDRCTRRAPEHVDLYVKDVHLDDMFPSEEKVHVLFVSHADRDGYDVRSALDLHGRYFFAKHRAYFDPPEDDALGIRLQFLPGETDMLSLEVVREAMGEVCAKFDLHRCTDTKHSF